MIAIACDHSALELKAEIEKLLEERGLEYKDFGTYTAESCHYPVYACRAAQAVAGGECDRGIVICRHRHWDVAGGQQGEGDPLCAVRRPVFRPDDPCP